MIINPTIFIRSFTYHQPASMGNSNENIFIHKLKDDFMIRLNLRGHCGNESTVIITIMVLKWTIFQKWEWKCAESVDGEANE